MSHRTGVFLLIAWLLQISSAAGQRPLVELELKDRRVEGTPVAWSNRDVLLLGRDGHLWNLDSTDVQSFRRLSEQFTSVNPAQLRGDLAGEFGRRFDVSGTGHYLVVHPRGQRDRWAQRFEQLYRSFVHYFTARGFRLEPLDFPLVAVVFHNHQEFLKHASADGAQLAAGTLGYYSSVTNRILLYDVTSGNEAMDDRWHVNADTIIHEAAHQSAFNCGIHSRYAMPPRWIVEGIGTAFEAPGVWNSGQYRARKDRVNVEQMSSFQQRLAKRPRGYLAQFISSDRPFANNTEAAYAEAWALTFFLVETRPREYFELIRRTASLPSFESYRAPDRLRDFTEVFGDNLDLLEAHFLRFINEQR